MKLREGGALSTPPSLNFIVGLSSVNNLLGFWFFKVQDISYGALR